MALMRVSIRQPNGKIDQLSVDSERIIIGSAGHCDIRLPVDQAAPEHVLVQVGPSGAYVQALNYQPPPTLNGAPFQSAPMTPESVLGVGQFQMMIAVSAGIHTAQIAERKDQSTSPITLFGGVAAIAIILWTTFSEPAQEQVKPAPREAPELWGAVIDQCPKGGEQARALAFERLAVANSRRERRPFHVQDGIQAVPLYEVASACFRAAGDQPSATDAANAATTLRRELSDDYRTHRVRLEHFLSVTDPPPPAPPLNLQSARKEVHLLLQFTEGKQGEYVTWLAALDRRLKLKLGRPAS